MELQELLQKIDALKAEIDALRPLSRDVEGRIMQKLRLDWNFHSSNIEGNSLTFGETKTFLLHGLTAEGKPLKDHLEIRGHNEAVEGLEDIIKGDRPLTEYEIKSLHQIILGEPYQIPAQTAEGLSTQRWVTPGKYKSQPNHVRTATGETFYFTSPEDTPAEMERLMVWYNEAMADQDLHPLITAATFHYKFIRIHPFDDGNGRIARILMNLVLMKGGFPPAIIRTDDKENYYRALRQADGDDLEAFIVYIGEQLVRSMKIYMQGARGEEIEEQDDIDKMIALFKAERKMQESILKDQWSTASVDKVINTSIRPLLAGVANRLSSFDELFIKTSLQLEIAGSLNDFRIHDDAYGVFVDKPTPEQVIKDYRSMQEMDAELNRVSVIKGITKILFVYKWKGYRYSVQDPFDYSIGLAINFQQYKYNVVFGGELQISNLYHVKVADDEIKQVSKKIAEYVLNELQRRSPLK